MKKSIFTMLSMALVILSSCKEEKNTPPPVNEEELITTVVLTFSPQSGGDVVEFRFTDLDGSGGNPPVISNGVLTDSSTYDVTVMLLNEAESPAEDLTAEVLAEAEEHQVFYLIEVGLEMDYIYQDTDADGNPIGLMTEFYTGASGSGNLQVVLRHQPDKSAQGVNVGDITNAGGETDVEVTFEVTIQ